MIILLFFADLDVALLLGVADDMVGNGVVDGLMRLWVMVDGGRAVSQAEAHAVRGSIRVLDSSQAWGT